ncbi:uracil-DNA glycosylase [Ramlibacter sp. USB13]|uniref:Uracil-DNA glycosylase n=1 Tax=Ramlibacter cellulosilyticus TaxID=2764187 RepID=A0A923MTE9_9BURK|nr:uracil-DNA glycosylase [Ramlibacter cellulosilyticus]MBC5785507.1 uracil-DNA glycosylase [Ramlibacter cellulosilyticus]
MATQSPLGFEDITGPLTRPLSAAWQDLPPAWRALCEGLDAHAAAIARKVDADAKSGTVAPARPFRAFELVAPQDVRLVVIGQDPYPRPGDATGLAFCSLKGIPASMRNVYKAFETHLPGFSRPRIADLEPWARQGVLLLNVALTVRQGEIGSHMKVGWQDWTMGVVRALYRTRVDAGQDVPVAWLWGKPAQEFFDATVAGLPVPAERVLRSRHPSNDFKQEFVQQAAAHLARLQELLDPPIRW